MQKRMRIDGNKWFPTKRDYKRKEVNVSIWERVILNGPAII